VAAEVIQRLALSAQCVFWNISLPRTTEQTESMADVFKSLIHQALRHSADLFTQFAEQLNLMKIHGSHTDQEWVDLICLVFSKMPNAFVVIETDGMNKMHGNDVDWANRFFRLLQTINDRTAAAGNCLKILLMVYGTVLKVVPDTLVNGNLLVNRYHLPPPYLRACGIWLDDQDLLRRAGSSDTENWICTVRRNITSSFHLAVEPP
jgi:hypothetical protein